MTTFLFTGDMLVMFFMVLVVVWVSVYATPATLDYSAQIPLTDEKITGKASHNVIGLNDGVDSTPETGTGGRT